MTTSNIPPGPVSWARTSAFVGMGEDLSTAPTWTSTIPDCYYPRYADERRCRVGPPLLHGPGHPAGGPGPARRPAGRVPRRAAGLPGQAPPGAHRAPGITESRARAPRGLPPGPAARGVSRCSTSCSPSTATTPRSAAARSASAARPPARPATCTAALRHRPGDVAGRGRVAGRARRDDDRRPARSILIATVPAAQLAQGGRSGSSPSRSTRRSRDMKIFVDRRDGRRRHPRHPRARGRRPRRHRRRPVGRQGRPGAIAGRRARRGRPVRRRRGRGRRRSATRWWSTWPPASRRSQGAPGSRAWDDERPAPPGGVEPPRRRRARAPGRSGSCRSRSPSPTWTTATSGSTRTTPSTTVGPFSGARRSPRPPTRPLLRRRAASGVVLRFAQFYAPDATHTDRLQHGGAPLRRQPVRRGARCATCPSSTRRTPGPRWRPRSTRRPASTTSSTTSRSPVTRPAGSWPRPTGVVAAVTIPRLVRAMAPASAKGLATSLRVSNRRFREATGWAPVHSSIRGSWPGSR